MTVIVQAIINGIGHMGRLLQRLPQSPFQNLEWLIPENPYIGAVLWVVPVGPMLTLLSTWLVAIGLYYAVKVPLRWTKLLKS